MSVAIPLLVSSIFALLAFWKKKLSWTGMLGAIFVGTSIFVGAGLYGFLILGFFFISSNVVDRLSKALFLARSGYVKEENEAGYDVAQKGNRRDVFQVFANGGLAAFAALGYLLFSDPLWLVVMCASLAAATADTWASELGRWSRTAPRHILTKKEVEPGTSGAITKLGTWASICGALCLGLLSVPLFVGEELGLSVGLACIIVFGAGWFGNWVDTYIGALWQVLYRCPVCQRRTEKEICHGPTQQIKGLSWMNNDLVNTLCTVSAGGCAAFFIIVLRFFF